MLHFEILTKKLRKNHHCTQEAKRGWDSCFWVLISELVYISCINFPSCLSSALLPPQHNLGNPKHHGSDGHSHNNLSWGWSLQHKLGGWAVTILHGWSDGALGALHCSTVLSADECHRPASAEAGLLSFPSCWKQTTADRATGLERARRHQEPC